MIERFTNKHSKPCCIIFDAYIITLIFQRITNG